MRNISILALIVILSCINLSTAGAQKWQQKADYLIQVSLDPKTHTLDGKLELTYTNNSPEALDSLYFHFWPNAYSNKKTPFANQQENVGNLTFRFAKAEDMGKMYDVEMQVAEKPVSIKYLDDFNEIGGIELSSPLQPGQSIKVQTSFKVLVPKMFSRLGRDGNHYCLTQWFPKVAKYDHKGWHRMPYLDLGEYFDDFGEYNVYITVPENYVVGGTGNLLTDSELEWLEERVKATERGNYSGEYGFISQEYDTVKTLHFHEKNIHDFAWFANPEYLVSKSEIKVDTLTVETWAFYPPEEAEVWQRATDYLGQSVIFYSKAVGNYPYKTVKAVSGPLNAGGGMEYPTITVISGGMDEPKRVILHEVGHNWFQGMLGTNERRFPYLDEGFNSYYENRYYIENEPATGVDKFFENIEGQILKHMRHRHNDQVCALHSAQYDELNYGMSIYYKSAENLLVLENYLGKDLMDSCMHTLFNEWQYRHPGPEDFEEVFERVSGANLDWFFHDMMCTYHNYDYDFKKHKEIDGKAHITIKNKGDYTAPFQLNILDQGGSGLSTVWIEGVKDDTTIIHQNPISKATLNADLPEIEMNNERNYLFVDHKKPFKLKLFNPINKSDERNLVMIPSFAFNTTDQTSLGILFMNPILPQPKFEYRLLPMFGLGSGNFNWMGNLQYNHFWKTDKRKNRFHIGLSSRSFGIAYKEFENDSLVNKVFHYKRLQPFVHYKFGPRFKHNISHELKLRTISRNLNIPQGRTYEQLWRTFVEGSYQFNKKKATMPYFINLALRGGDGMAQLRAELKGSFPYKEDRDIRFRVFAGSFLQNSSAGHANIYNFRLSNQAGFYDYLLDELIIDRATASSFYSRQMMWGEGGFSGPINILSSNTSLLAANISAQLPVTLLRIMANAAYLPDNNILSNPLQYELGLQLSIWKDVITINMPIFYSQEIEDILDLNQVGILDRITFTLNLTQLNPIELIKDGAGSLF
jgi:hypothetical protein